VAAVVLPGAVLPGAAVASWAVEEDVAQALNASQLIPSSPIEGGDKCRQKE
jgi:hypothetical protein